MGVNNYERRLVYGGAVGIIFESSSAKHGKESFLNLSPSTSPRFRDNGSDVPEWGDLPSLDEESVVSTSYISDAIRRRRSRSLSCNRIPCTVHPLSDPTQINVAPAKEQHRNPYNTSILPYTEHFDRTQQSCVSAVPPDHAGPNAERELIVFRYHEYPIPTGNPRVVCWDSDYLRRHALEVAMQRVGKLTRLSQRPLKVLRPPRRQPPVFSGIQEHISRRSPFRWRELTIDDF